MKLKNGYVNYVRNYKTLNQVMHIVTTILHKVIHHFVHILRVRNAILKTFALKIYFLRC